MFGGVPDKDSFALDLIGNVGDGEFVGERHSSATRGDEAFQNGRELGDDGGGLWGSSGWLEGKIGGPKLVRYRLGREFLVGHETDTFSVRILAPSLMLEECHLFLQFLNSLPENSFV
jgi:hypothetical protein